jgi:hypothetical protein
MNAIWNVFAAGMLSVATLVLAFIAVWLLLKLRAMLSQLACRHFWTEWGSVQRTLVGPFGTTVDPVQERRCTKCGFAQRAEFEKVKR